MVVQITTAFPLKKLDPSHRRAGIEQNPAGATSGWGVVCSERAPALFKERDAES
ncbi:MAG: hypothetical protein ACJ8CB_14990 [Ktedonobacteraceae bacterium]